MTLKNEIIGKKILIAGASGDIAQPVIENLITQSNRIGLTGYNSVERLEKYKSSNVKIYKCDLSIPQNGIDLVNDCPAKWTCMVSNVQVIMQYSGHSLTITYNLGHVDDGWSGVFYCYAATTDAEAVAACKTMGTDWDSDAEAVRYRIN